MPKDSKKEAKSKQEENVSDNVPEEKVVSKKSAKKEEPKKVAKEEPKKEVKVDAKKESKKEVAKEEPKKETKKGDKKDAPKEEVKSSKKEGKSDKSDTKVDAKKGGDKASKKEEKAPKKVQKGGDKEDDGEKAEKKSRSFKAIYVNTSGKVVMQGRYCGAKPKQAACKALSGIYKMFKQADEEIEGVIQFGVKECTRGSKGKFYWYSGERVTLDEPITLAIKKNTDGEGKEITYYFNNVVKKEHEDNCQHLLDYKCVDDDEDDKQAGG